MRTIEDTMLIAEDRKLVLQLLGFAGNCVARYTT